MKPILNEQEGRLYCLKRRLVRSAKTCSIPARVQLMKEIEELERDMVDDKAC